MGSTYVELLLFVLLGHVCFVGFGVADLVEIIGDDLDNIPFILGSRRSHDCVNMSHMVVGALRITIS